MDQIDADSQQIVDKVLRLVQMWQDGRPIFELLPRIKGREVYLTVRSISPAHPQWKPLLAMIRLLVEIDPTSSKGNYIHTTDGWWSVRLLQQMNAKFEALEDGRTRISFPIAHPWKIKPTDGYPEGVRGDPVYREPRTD